MRPRLLRIVQLGGTVTYVLIIAGITAFVLRAFITVGLSAHYDLVSLVHDAIEWLRTKPWIVACFGLAGLIIAVDIGFRLRGAYKAIDGRWH